MEPRPGQYYKHFKYGICKIIEIAKHSESLQEMVIYASKGQQRVWASPKSDFCGTLEDGITPRSALITDEACPYRPYKGFFFRIFEENDDWAYVIFRRNEVVTYGFDSEERAIAAAYGRIDYIVSSLVNACIEIESKVNAF